MGKAGRAIGLVALLLLGALAVGIWRWSRSGSAQAPAPAPSHRIASPAASATIVDRKVRDVTRAKILSAFEQKSWVRDPQTALWMPPGATKAQNLDAPYLRDVISKDFFPLATRCYRNALAKTPGLAGKLIVHFTITGDERVGGIVESAEIDDASDIEDQELRDCFRESMLSMTFKPPEQSGYVTVSYPFVLSPSSGDAGKRP
jgi:hypothetical protein